MKGAALRSPVSPEIEAASAHRKRILVVTSIFHRGGAEKVTYDLAKNFDPERYEVLFCALYEPGPMGDVFIRDGCRVFHGLMRNKVDARILYRLSRLIREHRIDLLYVLTQPVTLFWTLPVAKICRVPIVALVSNTIVVTEHVKLRTYHWLMRLVDRIVAVAETQKAALAQELHIPARLITVVRNGIDLRRFPQSSDLECVPSSQTHSDRQVVGLVARLVRLKAIDVFLQAAKQISGLRPDVRFVIVGTGPELEPLRTLARALGLERSVEFTGFLDEPAAQIAAFDVAVLCSRTEALPISILEYMAAGKPTVATDVGGVRELVTSGETGYIIEPDDPGTLAAKILNLLEDRATARRMGNRAREVAARDFSLPVMVRQTAMLVDELTKRRSSTRNV
jgi:glycosyltransferase involved in cell wall biosynthesis